MGQSRNQEHKRLVDLDNQFEVEFKMMTDTFYKNSEQQCNSKEMWWKEKQRMLNETRNVEIQRFKDHRNETAEFIKKTRDATINQQNKKCESAKERWSMILKNTQAAIDKRVDDLQKFQSETEDGYELRKQSITEGRSDFSVVKREIEDAKKDIQDLKARLLADELIELSNLKKQEQYNLKLANMLFDTKDDSVIFSRTRKCLELVYTALWQVRTSLSDLRVMFEEYNNRISHIKITNMNSANDLMNKDLNQNQRLRSLLEEQLHSDWIDNVQQVYEGAVGWVVFAKTGYTASIQLGNLPTYSMNVDLQGLADIYTKITNQNIGEIDQAIVDNIYDIIEESEGPRREHGSKTSTQIFCEKQNKDQACLFGR